MKLSSYMEHTSSHRKLISLPDAHTFVSEDTERPHKVWKGQMVPFAKGFGIVTATSSYLEGIGQLHKWLHAPRGLRHEQKVRTNGEIKRVWSNFGFFFFRTLLVYSPSVTVQL